MCETLDSKIRRLSLKRGIKGLLNARRLVQKKIKLKKTQYVLYFLKAGLARIGYIKYDTKISNLLVETLNWIMRFFS